MKLAELTKFTPMHTKLKTPIQEDQQQDELEVEDEVEETETVTPDAEPEVETAYPEDTDEFDDENEAGETDEIEAEEATPEVKPEGKSLSDRIVAFVERTPGATAREITKHLYANPTPRNATQVSSLLWSTTVTAKTPRLKRSLDGNVYVYFVVDAEVPEHLTVQEPKLKREKFSELAKREAKNLNRKIVHPSLPSAMHFDERIEIVLKDYVWETGKASPELKAFLQWYLKQTGRAE
jgi:hypothetical protein